MKENSGLKNASIYTKCSSCGDSPNAVRVMIHQMQFVWWIPSVRPFSESVCVVCNRKKSINDKGILPLATAKPTVVFLTALTKEHCRRREYSKQSSLVRTSTCRTRKNGGRNCRSCQSFRGCSGWVRCCIWPGSCSHRSLCFRWLRSSLRVIAARLCRKHAEPCRSQYPRHEHDTTVHEGARLANSWPSGEQQLFRYQHQYWSGWLRVVCCAWRILGRDTPTLWKVSMASIVAGQKSQFAA